MGGCPEAAELPVLHGALSSSLCVCCVRCDERVQLMKALCQPPWSTAPLGLREAGAQVQPGCGVGVRDWAGLPGACRSQAARVGLAAEPRD